MATITPDPNKIQIISPSRPVLQRLRPMGGWLKKHWLYLIAPSPFGLLQAGKTFIRWMFHGLWEDRVMGGTNHFMDDNAHWLKPIAVFVLDHPMLLFVLIIGGILLHAYMSTRPATDKALPQADITPQPLQGEMPTLRPRIVPVRFGRPIGQTFAGLVIVNDGEPAYSVSIPKIQIGHSTAVFDLSLPRLSKNDSEAFSDVVVRKTSGGTGYPGGLFDSMRTQNIDEVSLDIKYKDGDNRWYVTKCKLERDVMTSGGISVQFVGQELALTGGENNGADVLPSESWVKAGAGGPEVMLNWDLTDEAKNFAALLGRDRKQLILENTGNVDAHDVLIRDVSLTDKIAATFKLIPRLARGEKKPIEPTLTGQVPDNHQGEFLMVMYAAGNAPQYSHFDSSGTRLISVVFPILVTFKDYGEEYYRAHFEFSMDTVRHTEQLRYIGRDKLKRQHPS
jgi:hypothetical protein